MAKPTTAVKVFFTHCLRGYHSECKFLFVVCAAVSGPQGMSPDHATPWRLVTSELQKTAETQKH